MHSGRRLLIGSGTQWLSRRHPALSPRILKHKRGALLMRWEASRDLLLVPKSPSILCIDVAPYVAFWTYLGRAIGSAKATHACLAVLNLDSLPGDHCGHLTARQCASWCDKNLSIADASN